MDNLDPRLFEVSSSVSQRTVSSSTTTRPAATALGSHVLRHLLGYPDAETLDYQAKALIKQVALAARISCDIAVQCLLEYGLVDKKDIDEFTACAVSAITERLQLQFGERRRQKGRPSSQESRNALISDLIAKEVYRAFQLPAPAGALLPAVIADETSNDNDEPTDFEKKLAKQIMSLQARNSLAILLLMGNLLILLLAIFTSRLGPDLRNIVQFTGMHVLPRLPLRSFD